MHNIKYNATTTGYWTRVLPQMWSEFPDVTFWWQFSDGAKMTCQFDHSAGILQLPVNHVRNTLPQAAVMLTLHNAIETWEKKEQTL